MLKSAYTVIRALSLDVVAGAVISSMFLARILAVELPFTVPAALGLAVWVIYSADHLIDARQVEMPADSFRLRFHQKHFRILCILMSWAILAGICLIPLLPAPTLKAGLVIMGMVAVYFFVIRQMGSRPTFFKELMAALVYGMGVFAAPLSLLGAIDHVVVLLYLQFVLLAWVNLLEFSYFEIKLDRQHGFGSSVMLWGKTKTIKIVTVCLFLVALIALIGMGWQSEQSMMIKGQILILIMAVILAVILYIPEYFRRAERFRIMGDAVFLLPILIWL